MLSIFTQKKEIEENKLGFYCDTSIIKNISKKLIELNNRNYEELRLNAKKTYKNSYNKKIILDYFYKIISS